MSLKRKFDETQQNFIDSSQENTSDWHLVSISISDPNNYSIEINHLPDERMARRIDISPTCNSTLIGEELQKTKSIIDEVNKTNKQCRQLHLKVQSMSEKLKTLTSEVNDLNRYFRKIYKQTEKINSYLNRQISLSESE